MARTGGQRGREPSGSRHERQTGVVRPHKDAQMAAGIGAGRPGTRSHPNNSHCTCTCLAIAHLSKCPFNKA